jgi:hypothetical protein
MKYRVKPVYSPAVYAAMGQPWGVDAQRDEVDAPKLYESRADAQQTADSWKWNRTRAPHLAVTEWVSAMHNADEPCEFCDGRDAAQADEPEDANPYAAPETETDGTVGWWSTDHGMWRCGWLTEAYISSLDHLSDLGLRHIALARRRLRRDAERLAREADGQSVAELEALGIGRDRLRFVRGELQPRRMDGVVHAWLGDADRAGGVWSAQWLVFATRNGTELEAGNVRRSFRRVLAAAGLDPGEWTPRELRHSFVFAAVGARGDDRADRRSCRPRRHDGY